jgi:DNA polymerase III subunit alpha
MSAQDFAHLHLHTQYSFLDGAIRMKDLIKKTKELNMKSVAVTDHGNMFGALDFYQQATAAGIKPILGMEAYVTGINGTTTHKDHVRENFHMVLLAENNVGYDNLKKLSSTAFIDGKYYYPRVDRELLRHHSEGIIALTACLGGEVGKRAAKGDFDGSRAAARTFKDIFGEKNFFLEVQPNGIKKQEDVNGFLAQLSRDEGIQLAATNDCHYVTRDQHEAQNVLMAIRQQLPWGDPKLHKHETDAFYIRSGDEMWNLLQHDFANAFANTCDIAQRCKVNLELGKYYLPAFPIPSEYKDEPDFLRHCAVTGLQRRYNEIAYAVDRDQYMARLNTELECICKMGFAGYFLIVQEFINWSKGEGIRVGPGRGSGAGSLVAYALRITDLDPIPYDLLFERFLNPERVSMPDFDVDFMQERRGEVIDHVANKYGRDRVGQIATYAGLNPKSAIKDVARTLGVSFTEINELTKPMPLLIDGKKPDFDTALEYAPKLKELAATDDKFKKVIDVARSLEGLYRQAGMHAGGVVIGEKPLVEYVPLFSGNNQELVTQFDKDKVEAAGLVKFDFLGLKTLDVIEICERLVNARIAKENQLDVTGKQLARKRHPHAMRIEHTEHDAIPNLVVDVLNLDEPKVYKLIASGDTLGVFQVESTGMRDMCRRLKPTCFEDVVAGVALYRPGPMDAGMLDDFIERKHGRRKVSYPHALLEPVLRPTYGTIVYQEQVMQCAQVLANYSLGSADLLRRAMGKKKKEEMEKQKGSFVSGCKDNGLSDEQAADIFDTIEKFAGYGFNKSHSAAYALITFQTAYLKCFYPIEFMAALLTTEVGSTENVVKYIQEARSKGIEVLPPDVNVSNKSFSVDYTHDEVLHTRKKNKSTTYGRIRFGLSAVKGLGDAALDAIIHVRRIGGAFTSFYQFLETVDLDKVNKKVLEALVRSGAMDAFGRSRAQLEASLEKAVLIAAANRAERESAQFSLFGGSGAVQRKEYYDDNVGEWGHRDRLQREREAVGFYLSGHPLDRYVDDVRKMGSIPTVELTQVRHNSEATITGIVVGMKERVLKTGDGRWAVVTIEDTFGQAEVLCFSRVYETAEPLLKSGEPLVIKGRALIDDVDDEGKQLSPKMRAEEVVSLADAQIQRTRYLDITIPAPGKPGRPAAPAFFDPRESESLAADSTDDSVLKTIERVAHALQQFPGKVPARIRLAMPGGYDVTVQTGDAVRVLPTEALLSAIEKVAGVASVVRS